MLSGQIVISPKDVNNIIKKKIQFNYEFLFASKHNVKELCLFCLIKKSSLISGPNIRIETEKNFYKIKQGNIEINILGFFKETLSKIIEIGLNKKLREEYEKTINFDYLDSILNINKKKLITEKISNSTVRNYF